MTTGCTIGKGADIRRLEIPETDAAALWPIYDRYRDRFVSLRADCSVSPIKVTIEQVVPPDPDFGGTLISADPSRR